MQEERMPSNTKKALTTLLFYASAAKVLANTNNRTDFMVQPPTRCR
jgi:hypothetical protein